MKYKLIIVLAIASLLFASCRRINGSGNIISEKRNVGNFTGVQTEDVISVEVKNGPETVVDVEADDNVLPHIKTEVKNGQLRVYFKNIMSIGDVHAKVYVTAPVINELDVSGAASINSTGILKTNDKMKLFISGAGNIKAQLDAPDVAVDVSGSGSADLEGRTRHFSTDVSGAGNIKALDLLAETGDAKVSGAGSIRIHASVKLTAKVSGAGDVYYRGNPSLEQSVSGAGSVHKAE
jgi:hypothetical protein